MAIIHAAPETTEINTDEGVVRAFDLQTAINKAGPGDTVQLSPGVYDKPVVIGHGGAKGRALTIRGAPGGGSRIDGRRRKRDGLSGGLEPMDDDWSFFKIFRASHIAIEGLVVRNCWPMVLYMRGCADIAVRGCDVVGARYVVYARALKTHPAWRYLIEGVTWVQDPDYEMWRGEARWKEVKAKKGFADKSWFNGALFGSFDIQGDVTIRGCDVSHAFNGVRMDIRASRLKGAQKPKVKRNRNVRIHDNRFAFIRDNAVEPEMGAEGWLVAGNLFAQVHATLSLDGVTLRDFAFVGNRIINLERPGDGSNTGGKIIKFLGLPSDVGMLKPSRSAGFVTAFNSVRTRTRYVADAQMKPWVDANNAVERLIGPVKDADLDLFNKVVWDRRVTVLAMATNDPKYPASYGGPASLVSFPPLGSVFASKPQPIAPSAPFDIPKNTMTLSKPAKALASEPVEVFGPDKASATIGGAGLGVGAQSLSALGLDAWVATPPTEV
ncbi:MAG: hypothetical protein AAF360_07930 [Pseudomonadota bacterium]